MAKRTKVLAPGFAQKFREYLDKTGALLDQYKVPQELITALAHLDVDIEAEIEMEKLSSDKIIDILTKDEEIRDEVVDQITEWAADDNWEMILEQTIERHPRYKTVELRSLNEEIRFERFEKELAQSRI